MKPKVYFTRDITPENVVRLYHLLDVDLPGKVAVKVHSGEQGNQNYLTPEFWKPMVDEVGGTIVECNTAYGDASGGVRDHTETHWELMEEHGWTMYFDVDIMDAEGPDVVWPVHGGKQLAEYMLGVLNTVQWDEEQGLSENVGRILKGAVKPATIRAGTPLAAEIFLGRKVTRPSLPRLHPSLRTFAERLAQQVLSLPMGPHLTDAEVDEVVAAVRAFVPAI